MTAPIACGIDIGGTKIAGAVVAADGTVLAEGRVASPAAEPAAIVRTVAALIDELEAHHPFASVGVGAAGYIASDRSTVLFAPNIAWRNEPLGADIARATGKTVVVENDGNAAAWGEFRFGAGREHDDQLMVTVGTGVGGGVIIDGRLARGAHGVAGEIGHLRLVPAGRRCGCGNLGCLEQYGSGTALVREARQRVAQGAATTLLERAGGDVGAIDGPLITAAARDGDPAGVELLALIGHALGEGVASLCAVLDPAVVVVGGGVAEAGELLLRPLRAAFEQELTGRGFRPQAEIRSAHLGGAAGVVGAADLART